MVTTCPAFKHSPNPRVRSCARCGLTPESHGLRDRDHALETRIVDIAARAAGFVAADPANPAETRGDDGGLAAFADQRAWPGGVRADLDGIKEACEEIADACSYLRWDIVAIWPQVEAGEPEALDRYSQAMGALSALVTVWHALHRIPS
jgi:hypothetical protein